MFRSIEEIRNEFYERYRERLQQKTEVIKNLMRLTNY